VKVTPPAGGKFTTQSSGKTHCDDSHVDPATGITTQVTLNAAHPVDLCQDAGIVPPNTLGDYVWRDAHHDGVQHPDNPGVNGVKVALLSCDGTPVKGPDGKPMTAVTGPAPKGLTPANDKSGDGFYRFVDLLDGCYKVKFTPPSGTKLTTQFVGDHCADSHPDPSSGLGTAVTLEASHRLDLCQDAGLAISDHSVASTGRDLIRALSVACWLLVAGGGLLIGARRRRRA
jgi:hypothetical protein